MEELYWIMVLNKLNTFFGITLAVTILGAFGYTITYMIGLTEKDENILKVSKFFKKFVPATIIVALLFTVTPSRKDSLLIFGLGGIVDYIQSSNKAKQLPDKCIDALNAYLDSIKENEDKRGR